MEGIAQQPVCTFEHLSGHRLTRSKLCHSFDSSADNNNNDIDNNNKNNNNSNNCVNHTDRKDLLKNENMHILIFSK